jgi:hypothetical protein
VKVHGRLPASGDASGDEHGVGSAAARRQRRSGARERTSRTIRAAREHKAAAGAVRGLAACGLLGLYEVAASVFYEPMVAAGCRLVFLPSALVTGHRDGGIDLRAGCVEFVDEFNPCNLTVYGGGIPFQREFDSGDFVEPVLRPLAQRPYLLPLAAVLGPNGVLSVGWRQRKEAPDGRREGGWLYCETHRHVSEVVRPTPRPTHPPPTPRPVPYP